MDALAAVAQLENVQGILSSLALLNLIGYEWPKHTDVKDGAKFDFIVVGAGTAGCVVANRLIEQGNYSVLLIEAGGNPPFESEMPDLFPYMKRSSADWNFTSTSDSYSMPTHKDNAVEIIQGKMIGGTASLNYLGYARGNPDDYDKWAKLTNDSTWSWESVLSTFKKNEQLIDKTILNSPHKDFYGTDGHIKISNQYFKKNEDYFSAFEELGWDCPLDLNPDTPLGFKNVMFGIGDGVRQSTAYNFLSPIKDNPNLYVMKNTLATKLIFDKHGKIVIGVELLTKNGKMITVKVKNVVIVSAGVIKSPQLLMLSGIGPERNLRRHGIKVVADLPVGQSLQDHVNMHLIYEMTKAKREEPHDINPHKYAYTILQGHVALNQSQRFPDYEIIGLTIPEKYILLGFCSFYFNFDYKYCSVLNRKMGSSEIFLGIITNLYPKSRGKVLLASTDPNEQPIIDLGYFNNEEDVVKHVKYFHDFNRIMKTSHFKKVDAKLVLPELEHCSGLKEDSEDYWRCYAVGMSDTAYYYVGTCGMGSVLDSRLRVLGVENLRVIDASSFPDTVGTFTQATVIMLAQKGAEFIIKDHYLK